MEKNTATVFEEIMKECKENGYSVNDFYEQILYFLNVLNKTHREQDRLLAYAKTLLASPVEDILKAKFFDKGGMRDVEKQCGMNEGLLSNVNAPYRSQEEGWRHTFTNIIKTIAEYPLDDEDAKNLAYQLLKYVCNEPRAKTMATSPIIAELASSAADIKDGEEVLDGAVGLGDLIGECVNNKKVHIAINDIDDRNARVAALFLNLSGEHDITTMVGDFTMLNFEKKYDKVVMNIPFGLKVKELEDHQKNILIAHMNTDSCKEGDVLFVAEGFEARKNNGRLVIVVPQSFLFRQGKTACSRKYLCGTNRLRAVIDLPLGLDNTRVKTSMLVFEEENHDVIYVDASKLINRGRRTEASITTENKRLLTEIINEKKEVEGISHRVSVDEIKETGDWSYSRYFKEATEVVYRSIKDINKDINECMEQISAIDNKIGKMQLFN